MSKIILETFIKAPIERCFDLSRNIDAHLESASQTQERAVAGVITGLMNLNDEVTWDAKHFGIRQRLRVKITQMTPPTHFRDSQVEGIFAKMDHDHYFEEKDDGTLMRDVFDFECPYGLLGACVDGIVYRYLKKFLIKRNTVLKNLAENMNK